MFIAPYFDYVSGGLLGAGTPTGDKLGSVTDGWILDFENGKILVRDTVTQANAVYDDIENEVTGWGTGYYAEDAAGDWTEITGFRECYVSGANAGFLFWPATTNDCLYCRDWTQSGSWTATNMSTALDATGIDGSANTATTLTADANNATILQTITHTSQNTIFGLWMRRVTGSGNIYITADGDGGSSETLKAITGSWAQYYINIASLTNPVVGVKIATSGNVIEVDFALSELDGRTRPSPPILTTSAAASSAGPNLVLPTVPIGATGNTIVVEEYIPHEIGSSGQNFLEVFVDGSNLNRYEASGGDQLLHWTHDAGSSNLHYGANPSLTAEAFEVLGMSGEENNSVLSVEGSTDGTADTTVNYPDLSSSPTIYFGRRSNNSNQLSRYLRHLIWIPTYNDQTALNTLTS